jgi:hypothetical protein
MGLREVIWSVARTAPTPVFAVVGGGSRHAVQRLRLNPGLELVASPRRAAVLLVAGRFRGEDIPGLSVVHDQMPPPRVTVRWLGEQLPELPGALHVTGDESDLAAAIVGLGNGGLADPAQWEQPIQPDVDQVEWRGVGPYGHGGKGMTGGTPFGRPLAERAPDRDGLELDQIPVTFGPWGGPLPAGTRLRVGLQGDLVQQVELEAPIVASEPRGVFEAALQAPQPIADIELARARHHLYWLAEALTVHGLAAMGTRAVRIAGELSTHSIQPVQQLSRMVRRSGVHRLALRGLGVVQASEAAGLGPVARASGQDDDARVDDRAYREIGFRPLTGDTGDAAARWRQRLAEIAQAVELAARAGDRTAFGNGVVEGPRGRLTLDGPPPGARINAGLPDWLPGLEWGDAVSVVWSLDPDPGVPSVAVAERAAS